MASSIEKECESTMSAFDKLNKVRLGIRKSLEKGEALVKALAKGEDSGRKARLLQTEKA